MELGKNIFLSVTKLASLYLAYGYVNNRRTNHVSHHSKEIQQTETFSQVEIEEERKKFNLIMKDQIRDHIIQINSDLLSMSR